jgi:hypothetical protein
LALEMLRLLVLISKAKNRVIDRPWGTNLIKLISPFTMTSRLGAIM